MLVYAVVRQRRLGWWLLWLMAPVVAVVTYVKISQWLYGSDHLWYSGLYAWRQSWKPGETALGKLVIGLAFAGACLLPAAFFVHRVTSRRWFEVGGVLLALLIVFFWLMYDTTLSHGVAAQVVVCGVVGVIVLGLASMTWWANKSAETAMLALWLFGTFAFAVFVNWTVNGRSVLPMVPAMAILVMMAWKRHRSGAATRGGAKAGRSFPPRLSHSSWPQPITASLGAPVTWRWRSTGSMATAPVLSGFKAIGDSNTTCRNSATSLMTFSTRACTPVTWWCNRAPTPIFGNFEEVVP